MKAIYANDCVHVRLKEKGIEVFEKEKINYPYFNGYICNNGIYAIPICIFMHMFGKYISFNNENVYFDMIIGIRENQIYEWE